MKPRQPAPTECAQCGAEIPARAAACPECGADERTGWRETSPYDGLDLPESAWSDESPSEGAQPGADRRVNGIAWYWWAVGVALLLILGLGALALL
ncbi:MAG: zinc ribbon domain-containing protein [Opitutus sp.]